MGTCFCMGPQNGEPVCPCRMRNVHKKNNRWVFHEEHDLGPVYEPFDDWLKDYKNTKKKSGFVPLPKSKQPCRDPSHGPPNMLYVPPGHMYIHICPSCGAEARILPSPISM